MRGVGKPTLFAYMGRPLFRSHIRYASRHFRSFYKTVEMGLSRLTHNIQQGFMSGKRFLGHAYHEGKKFLSHIDNYADIARNVIGAVAPVVGSMSGPVGAAVGAAFGRRLVSTTA